MDKGELTGMLLIDLRKAFDLVDREVSSVSLFERLDWLLIDLCIKYLEVIQVYNILDGSCPEYLKGFIKSVDHGRNTRNSNNTNMLKVTKTNLKIGEKSFKFKASDLWNGLKTLKIAHCTVNPGQWQFWGVYEDIG